jgi:hypothetical protein
MIVPQLYGIKAAKNGLCPKLALSNARKLRVSDLETTEINFMDHPSPIPMSGLRSLSQRCGSGRLSLYHFVSESFELSSFGFTIHPLALSATRRFSQFALRDSKGNAFDQRLQTMQGIFFVLFLSAVLLGFDDNDAIFGNAAIA